MAILPDQFLGADKLPGTELDRDGLCEFEASLFLDPDLLESHTTDVMVQADFLRYQSSSPRPLRGIHAALDIDDATLIAIPDAVHRGWLPFDQGTTAASPQSALLPHA